MKKFILSILIISTSLSALAQKDLTRILFIFDASNSMNDKWEGERKIDIAKEMLIQTVDSMQYIPNLEVALRVYGHQSPITPTFQDCNDTKLEVPFAPSNFGQLKGTIRGLHAKGTTPIARSLEKSADDFPDREANNIIILITDGLEACDEDPCIIAQRLKDKGIRVKPFVIGLGIDLAYLKKFDCIGTFLDAKDKIAFRNVLKTVVDQAISNTTVQVNLLNTVKSPSETDVTMFFYEAGTKELKYTFVHTLNYRGKPDTLTIDPKIKYDIYVNTLPAVEKKDVTIIPNKHNIIPIDAPQGYLQLKLNSNTGSHEVNMIVRKHGDMKTINVQNNPKIEKYIVGSYDVEILTLPRIYINDVHVGQSSVNTLGIPSPGLFQFSAYNGLVGQIFVFKDGKWEWVCNLEENTRSGYFYLQPGSYQINYRYKKDNSVVYGKSQNFNIGSNQRINLKL